MEMEQLYKEHSDRVYSYIYLLVRQRDCAEDLTQETFYKAYNGLKMEEVKLMLDEFAEN